MTLAIRMVACGSYVPKRIMTNDDLSAIMDTNDQWIRDRSGIRQRHIAADGEYTSDMAYHAAQQALQRASLTGSDIDAIIVATSTPDNTFPATATKVQHRLGSTAFAFDVQAVCSGFLYGLAVADSMMKNPAMPSIQRALVIGAESYSRILNWNDRSTAVLFGDGAGAAVLEKTNGDAGIERIRLYSDGGDYDALYVNGGPSTTGQAGHLCMNGKEIYRKAVTYLTQSSQQVLRDASRDADEVTWLIPHQANKRIMDKVADQLSIERQKLVVTVDRHANTSSASIPLALALWQEEGRLHKGDVLLLNAIGGGLTWGAALVRW